MNGHSNNHIRKVERETAHLPADMAKAISYFRLQIRQHHAAMMSVNVDDTMQLRGEAHKLSLKLNGGEAGIIAEPDAPSCILYLQRTQKRWCSFNP